MAADPPLDLGEVVARVTRVVREADRQFGTSGGSSRHWVRDHFLPLLEQEGLCITDRTLVEQLAGALDDLVFQVTGLRPVPEVLSLEQATAALSLVRLPEEGRA